jgi:CubicO group peptidase (beta-lactamase class C family)
VCATNADVIRLTTGRTLLALVLAAGTVACVGEDGGGDTADDAAGDGEPAAAAAPVAAVGEWRVDPPDGHGLDPVLLEEARDYAFADGRNTQGVVIVHEGAIVGEWYATGSDADSWAASWSMAKSFTSAAIGIALDEGLIPSVDEPMTTWYPDFAGTERADMTLRDVLQMGSGLAWVEDYSPGAGESDIIQMVLDERDQLAYAASRPAEVEPGTRWSYSSGDTQLLSGVLAQATGMPADEYAEEKLFEPLGMSQVEWWRDAADHTLTYCCLDTTSRDFARFGQLYLQGGVWGDEQVVPAGWVEDSWQPSDASEAIDEPYGYQWWLSDPEGLDVDLTSAAGHDGQWIHVVPELDLVVVRNGTYVKDPGPPVADPTLFPLYPSDGLVEGKGTSPPDDWDTAAFLAPIVEAARAEG